MCMIGAGRIYLIMVGLNSTVSFILYQLLKRRPEMNTLGYQTWASFLQKARNYVHKIIF